jgi:hypothetical protein
MRIPKSKTILVGTMGLALIFTFFLLKRPGIPQHAGRPVSAWFKDLCSGVYGGTPRANGFEKAYAAFSQMDSNAIPYLTKQLRYDRSGWRQNLIYHLRQYTVTRPLGDYFMWPTERRNYAAVALRRMGPNAETAIPSLLEAWARDVPAVKVNAVAALASILGRETPDGLRPAEWKKLESDVIAEASERYPRSAEDLNINPKRVP